MKENKCWECLRGIEENIASGKWKEIDSPLSYWYEMFDAENAFIKNLLSELNPKTVLEIGAGAGRIIELVIKNSDAKLTSFEKDPEMYGLVTERFGNNERLEIILTEGEFPTDKKFDLAVCMMNTLGNQENENELLEYALSVSARVIFTVYKKGSEEIRRGIYEAQGHEKYSLEGCNFYFSDDWVKGLVSKSYSKEDIEKICGNLNCKVRISDLCDIAYIVELEK